MANTHTAYTGKRDPINCPANQLKKLSDEVHERVEATVAKVKETCQPKPTGARNDVNLAQETARIAQDAIKRRRAGEAPTHTTRSGS